MPAIATERYACAKTCHRQVRVQTLGVASQLETARGLPVLYESICILISEPAARHYPDNNKNAQARDPSLSRTAETRVTFPRSVRGASAATRKVRPAKLAKLQARTLTVTRSHGTSAIEPNPNISDFLFFRKFVHSTLCICTCTKSNSILSWAYGSGRRQASREVSSLVTRG